MTVTEMIAADSAEPPTQPQTGGDEASARARCIVRARFWRLALGVLGLFWVAAMLLLAR